METFSRTAVWAFCLLFSSGLGVSLASCFVFRHHVAEASDLCFHKCMRARAHLHVNIAALGGRKPLFKDKRFVQILHTTLPATSASKMKHCHFPSDSSLVQDAQWLNLRPQGWLWLPPRPEDQKMHFLGNQISNTVVWCKHWDTWMSRDPRF